MRRVVLATVAATAMAGCGEGSDAPPTTPTLALEDVTRFGSLDGAGSALSHVNGVALTDSTVLILESDPVRIAVFSRDGRWLQDLGREGDGPGEFACPTEIGIFEGDIWVADPCGGRLEVLAADGTPLRSRRWSIPPDSVSERALPAAIMADGSVLASPRRVIRPGERRFAYYRTTLGGEISQVLHRVTRSERDAFIIQLPEQGSIFLGLHPLQESPIVDAFPDGSGLLVVERWEATRADTATFRIQVVASDGNVETDVPVPYLPISAEGWLDRYVAEREADMLEREGVIDRQYSDGLREQLSQRAFYPPVTQAVAGSDGSIWIRREELPGDSVMWQVYGRDGDLVGALSAPRDLEVILPALDEVWAVERNELDVPFVLQMSVVPR